jgi:glycosyltransferase involved in cell wall biosynthesis
MITALMPLRNYHADFLRACVRSLFHQTSPAWRLLVIVERKDRATFSDLLAEELADPRVTMIPNEGRKLSGAMNTGMRAARTPFVAILLADDMWAANAVEVLTRHIQGHPDVDFFHSSRRYVDETGAPISSVFPSRPSFDVRDFRSGSPVKHLLCWRRELGLAIGGLDESLNGVGPDDWDFPWSMAERGARFLAVPDALYLYRDHRSAPRLTTHLPRSVHLREIERILRKHQAPPREIREKLARARATYLQQCLYRNRFDKWLKNLVGHDAGGGWRERYR